MEAKPNRSPLTVIVAEKHPIARAALAALLSYDGHRVFQADSPKAAISWLATVDNIAALLVDLEMPDWRSILRHAVKIADLFIIAMEGTQPISALYDLNERGVRVCLQKPIIYDDLRRVISENIGPNEASGFRKAERKPETSERNAGRIAKDLKCKLRLLPRSLSRDPSDIEL